MEGFNMGDMLGKVMEMRQKMEQAQQALAEKTVTVEAGGGMVTVTANGARRITAIKIEPSVIDKDDPEMLEDLVLAGINKALGEAEQMAQNELRNTAGGFLPPGFDPGQLGL